MMLELALDVSRVPRARRARCSIVEHHRRALLRRAATRTCRTACRRSTNTMRDLRLEAARRHARGAARASSTPIAARSPTRAGWSTRCADEARAEGRRRHLRGTREGVPRLGRAARARTAPARPSSSASAPTTPGGRCDGCSGPASSARSRAPRSCEHYGLRTLLYGTLLPGPDIGRRCADEHARGARRRLRGRHPLLGPRALAGRRRRARRRLDRARDARAPCERFRRSSASGRRRCGAAGWQINATRRAGRSARSFDYASDTRGRTPFPAAVERRGASAARRCRPRCRRSTS